ncbi:MAG: M28 family peptidase, partial [Anaerolineae bacterium]
PEGGDVAPAQSGERSAALPTWTLPPGLERSPRPSGAGAIGAIPTLGADTGALAGGSGSSGIPAPTVRPTVELAGSAPALTDLDVLALMAEVDQRRLADDVRHLAAMDDRSAVAGSGGEDGVADTPQWLFDRFDKLDARQDRQVQVELEEFDARIDDRRATIRNVIATAPGIGLDKRIVYVTAHYDVRPASADGEQAASGADDDASGTAALLELARVMSERRWDATIRFVAFGASESGLAGSQHHAPLARRIGLPIEAVLDADTIGGSTMGEAGDGQLRLRAYSDAGPEGESRQLARYAQVIAERYMAANLDVVDAADPVWDRGDHTSFSEAGFPALRLSAAGDDAGHLDGPGDTADRIDAGYLADATRLILAVVANLALAPPAPTSAPTLAASPDVPGSLLVTWDAGASPGAGGYWVAVRSGGSQTYDRLEWAGPGPSYTVVGLTPGDRVSVSIAAADDMGHLSRFSPEATR